MNRTYLVLLNVLITSIYSTARPIDIVSPTSFEDENYKIDDQALRIPDETDDVLPVFVRKDDLISTSNLNKIYTIEHKFSTTRSLKDETENEGFKTADSKQVSGTTKLKSAKDIEDEPEERSDTTEVEDIKTRIDKRVESKSSERSSAPATSEEEKSKTVKQEKKSGTAAKTAKESKTATQEESTTLEKSDTAAEVGQSKHTKKEESKTDKFTSELNELEKTTTSFRREVKDTDYLENDEFEINDKVAPQQDSERKGYEMLINDESNSSWDLLDDLPASRRMISQPDHLNTAGKQKAGNEIVQPVEARNVLETKITSRNDISHNNNMFGLPATPIIPIPQFRSTVSVPHIHSALLPQRRFIVPGFIKVPPVVTIHFRRLLNQEENNILNRNIEYEYVERHNSNNVMKQNRNIVLNPNERSEVPPKFRDVEDYKSEDLSNAYPYAPVDLYSPNTPQASTLNPLFTKLIEASEHPQRSTPNINREYVQNFPNIPHSNNISPDKNNYYANNGVNMQNYPSVSYARPNNYAVPQNYGRFKDVTGFGRPPLY